jgi:hypothetical protein
MKKRLISDECDVEELIKKLQPKYSLFISKFSKSYSRGSIWYVGDDLMEWWRNCNTVRYYEKYKMQLECIEEILKDQ